ncbi:uncharacterized protein LOC131948102 [Physella acuta]|uniref:uncharacterized protein LOC131948102 n=1 Tax=Physella acuta TaxID=109671 RepID=UPI0027DCB10C|nr:uncharacterized protein LOC131948102 [Physella acuta]
MDKTFLFVCSWILHCGYGASPSICPAPASNRTSSTGHLSPVVLVSCSRGCCTDSTDGCCYRTTDDVVVYAAPICVVAVLCAVVLFLLWLRRKRTQERLLAESKPATPTTYDNPPSYSSCVIPVTSTADLTSFDVNTEVQVDVHRHEKEEDPPLPPPPIYDDIFRNGEDQIAVISPTGRVSFVDLCVLSSTACCHANKDAGGTSACEEGCVNYRDDVTQTTEVDESDIPQCTGYTSTETSGIPSYDDCTSTEKPAAAKATFYLHSEHT